MSRRDAIWRGIGGAMVAMGMAAILHARNGADAAPAFAPLGVLVAILGLVLVVQGKRVPNALRIEGSRHRQLPLAIHARHHLRRRRH